MTHRHPSRAFAFAFVGIVLGLMPGSANARDHHSVPSILRNYGIHGNMAQGGFYVDLVYEGTEAYDNGLAVGDLIVKGNGDFLITPADIVEDLVNSQRGGGPAVFLVRKGRTGRYVQVVATGY